VSLDEPTFVTIEGKTIGFAEAKQRDRRKKFAQWFRVCERLHSAVVNFYARDSNDADMAPDERVVRDNVELHEATAIGSKVQSDYLKNNPMHQIMLDLDTPHVYVDSTQEGHGHLIFRKQVTWDSYMKFLRACADVGILEWGYVNCAKKRGETWLRTPWTPKGSTTKEDW
jgi:hypothetical protein